MDVSTTSSQNLFSYQAALAGGTQSQAVLQTLAKAYSQSSGSLDNSDGLSGLAGQANLGPLVSAIYAQASAAQTSGTTAQASGVSGLQLGSYYGNLDSGAAAGLLTQTFGSSSSSSDGFGLGISSTTTLASAAADARKAYGTGTLTQDAQTQASAIQPTEGTTAGSNNALTYLTQAASAAQLAAMNNTFTLLA
jgi:hypothetical protein